MRKEAYERITKEYVKSLFLEDNIPVSDVKDIIRKPDGFIDLRITYEAGPIAKWLRIRPPSPKIKKAPIYKIGATLQIAGKKEVTFSISEERFISKTREFVPSFLFNRYEEKIQHPKGFPGFKSIWEYILIEFKKIYPYI